MKQLLEVSELSTSAVSRLLNRASAFKADPSNIAPVLRGHNVAMLFEKPSTRTRLSTEAAVVRLGGHPMYLRGDEVGLGQRESVEDVVRTISKYADIFAARVFEHQNLELAADIGCIPVLNLLSNRAHPCQAFADALTIREHFGERSDLRIAFLGDGNNVANSLAWISIRLGMEFRIASPEGYQLDAAVVRQIEDDGGHVFCTTDPYEAVNGADVVYTDVWTSMGDEHEAAERLTAFPPYQLNQNLMESASEHAIVLHCLPAHRGEEITADVIESPQSKVWEQAENRMWSVMAVLASMSGAENE